MFILRIQFHLIDVKPTKRLKEKIRKKEMGKSINKIVKYIQWWNPTK